MHPLSTPSVVLIVPLLSFYKDGFGIKLPGNVDMPLNNKQTKAVIKYLEEVVLLWIEKVAAERHFCDHIIPNIRPLNSPNCDFLEYLFLFFCFGFFI